MSKASDDRIRRWIPAIEQVRDDLGLTAQQYPTWVVLTLINIESNGNQDAHSIRNGSPSQFYGLLQIGINASRDIGRRNTDHDGNGVLAIDSFLRYAERYARGPTRHNYDPEKISIVWKSGPGTLKRYIRIQNDQGQTAAETYLSQLWGGSSLKYLNKFRKLAKKWSNGKAQLADPALILPSSGRRQYDAPSSTGLPDCPPLQPAVSIATPNQTLARDTQRAAEEALAVSQAGGATGFKTDPADPAVLAGQRARTIRIIRNGRFDTAPAVFPPPTSAVDYVRPLVAPSLAVGFGAPLGQSNEVLDGVEYDTSADPNQTVHAIAAGTVTKVGITRARGNVVTVNHDGFLVSVYGHLGEVLVAVGDAVKPGDIIARAGQTLGRIKPTAPNETPTEELIAVAKARRDPVLYFALRGDAALFEAGAASSSADFGTRPLPIDPNAVLLTAPDPGTVTKEMRVEVAQMMETRNNYAELAMTASTPNALLDAEGAYDTVTAMSRASELAGMSRAAYSTQEDTQRPVRTAFGNTSLALNSSDF